VTPLVVGDALAVNEERLFAGATPEPIATVRGFAEEPGMFRDLLEVADRVIEIARTYELIVKSDGQEPKLPGFSRDLQEGAKTN
jgi:hypothetical protein